MRKTYTVVVNYEDTRGKNARLGASKSSLAYCEGYVTRHLEAYPCPAIEIVCDQSNEVVRSYPANSEIQLNKGN